MGARGKKRRRKDGSVATGKAAPRRMADYNLDPVDVVPVEALSESLQDALPSEFLSDSELDELHDAGFGQIEAIADRYAVDVEALEARTSKLIWFLKQRGDLSRAPRNEPFPVDPKLVEYAATVAIRFGDELMVRDQQSPPVVE